MSQENTVTEHHVTASHLEDVLAFVDDLHNAASEGNTHDFTGLNETDVINYLRDIIYTAQEAINEIETRKAQRQPKPVLRIVERITKAG